MNGRQSLLNDIKTHVRRGGNVTHILHVKVSREPSADIGHLIRQKIFRAIANVAITKIVNGQQITLTWRTTATTTSAYYHCDAVFFNDNAVKAHTKELLAGLLSTLNASFNNIFANGTTGLTFLVTKRQNHSPEKLLLLMMMIMMIMIMMMIMMDDDVFVH